MRIVPDNNRQIIHNLSTRPEVPETSVSPLLSGPHRFVPALRGVPVPHLPGRGFPAGQRNASSFNPKSLHHDIHPNSATVRSARRGGGLRRGESRGRRPRHPHRGRKGGYARSPAFRRGGHGPLRRRPRPAPGAPLHPPRRQHGILRRHGTRRKGRGHGRSRRNASGRHGGDGSGEDLPAGTGSRGSPGAADDPAPPPDHPGRSLRRADPADRRRRRSGGDGPGQPIR